VAGLLLIVLFGDPAIEGNILLRQGRCPDALPLLRTATQNNSSYALAWYDLAYCYRKTGQHREAVAAYRQYATLRPGSPDPYYGLGVALRALGDVDGARTAFEMYIALEKRPSEQRWVDKARQEIADLTSKRVAVAGPKPVVATPAVAPKPMPAPPVVAVAPPPKPVPIVTPPPPPKSAELSTDVARAAIAEHRWPDAEAELDRVIAAHPDDRAAFLLRCEVRRALNNPRGAADDATRALRLRPGDPTAVRLLGEALTAAGDREQGHYYLELYRYLMQRSGN
jgi:predicted Zn-dependent protease